MGHVELSSALGVGVIIPIYLSLGVKNSPHKPGHTPIHTSHFEESGGEGPCGWRGSEFRYRLLSLFAAVVAVAAAVATTRRQPSAAALMLLPSSPAPSPPARCCRCHRRCYRHRCDGAVVAITSVPPLSQPPPTRRRCQRRCRHCRRHPRIAIADILLVVSTVAAAVAGVMLVAAAFASASNQRSQIP